MKVVVLSPFRSATQSTSALLENLGYKSLHYGGHIMNKTQYGISSEKIFETMHSIIDNFDAFSDNPFPVMYEYFDQTYPGSKFIMIKRDPESWYKSIISLSKYLNRTRINSFEKTFFEKYLDNVPLKFKDIPYDDYIFCYNHHVEAVEEYFKNKDNLILLDIFDEKKGIKIADFLGKDFFPKIDFVDKSFSWV